jgi:hypothetical protein
VLQDRLVSVVVELAELLVPVELDAVVELEPCVELEVVTVALDELGLVTVDELDAVVEGWVVDEAEDVELWPVVVDPDPEERAR